MPLDGDALARRLAPTANLRLEFLKGAEIKDQTTVWGKIKDDAHRSHRWE